MLLSPVRFAIKWLGVASEFDVCPRQAKALLPGFMEYNSSTEENYDTHP